MVRRSQASSRKELDSLKEEMNILEGRVSVLEKQAPLWNLTRALVFAGTGTALTATVYALLKSIGLVK